MKMQAGTRWRILAEIGKEIHEIDVVTDARHRARYCALRDRHKLPPLAAMESEGDERPLMVMAWLALIMDAYPGVPDSIEWPLSHILGVLPICADGTPAEDPEDAAVEIRPTAPPLPSASQ